MTAGTEQPVRRVQRVASTWPVVHLEQTPAAVAHLDVNGLVRHPRRLALPALRTLSVVERDVAVHCVWGWSRPHATWRGVSVADLLDLAEPDARATHLVVGSASGTYSSCLALEDARSGIVAWERDGGELSEDGGGPLRFIAPPTYWAYKHVKWASSLQVVDRFSPGFWESRVADPVGRISLEVELP
jgi:DMSO/TMAO reductase YedYZ molybdopterin-dependent catalytic subunit